MLWTNNNTKNLSFKFSLKAKKLLEKFNIFSTDRCKQQFIASIKRTKI